MSDETRMTRSSRPIEDDRLARVWGRLADRPRDMTVRFNSGQTLEAIGAIYGVSRERVRQIIGHVERVLSAFADQSWPGWRDRVSTRMAREVVVAEEDLSEIPAAGAPEAKRVLLRHLGLRPSKTWAGRLDALWGVTATSLDGMLRKLATQAPIPAGELRERATALGIPAAVPLEEIAAHQSSPLTRGPEGHWVRRRATQRDAAYLWLVHEGEPREPERLADAIRATSIRGIEEAMRRDERFRKLQPEGLWALAEWTVPHSSPYTNALDAMLEVLREEAPLTKAELFARTARLYPVSTSRMQQCLLSDQIGVRRDGRFDLVENGATPVEESEPRRPPTMAIGPDGQVLGARLVVDRELLRGSGVLVHSWLTWRLGLRLAPTSRTFHLRRTDEIVTVRRTTSAAQVSALRSLVQPMGVTVGCRLVLLFHLNTDEMDPRHVCEAGGCPARAS